MPDAPDAPPRSYLLPEPVLRGLLEYLRTRPYREVAEAVPILESLPLASEPPQPEREQ